MNGAELKSTLDVLGLTPVWFAERCGATRRSVIRWCDGESRVPEHAVLELKRIEAHTLEVIDDLVTDYEPDDDGVVVFGTYRTDVEFWRDVLSAEFPAVWHRILTARAADDVARATHWTVRVDYVRA